MTIKFTFYKEKISPMVPLLLFVFSFILRLALISKGPFSVDCLYLAIKAQNTLDTGQLNYLYGPGYPLTVLLTAGLIGLARLLDISDPVIVANFMSILFSSLSIPLLYLIARKILNHTTAFFCSFLFSISPVFLGVSLYGKSHAPSLFFLFLSINFLINHIGQSKTKDLWFSALALGAMGATRLQDMILMIIPISILFLAKEINDPFLRNQRATYHKIIRSFFFYWTIVFLFAGAFHLPFIFNKETPFYYKQFSFFWSDGVIHNFQGLLSPYLYRGLFTLEKNCTILGGFIAFIGFIFLFRDSVHIFLFCFCWFIIPFLFYSNLWTSVSRLYTLILPPFLLAVSYGLYRLLRLNDLIKLITLIIFFAIGFTPFIFYFSDIYARHKQALLPDHAKWVAEQIEPDAQIIVSDDAQFYIYYGNCKILRRPLKDGQPYEDADISDFKNKLDDLLDQGVPVYITRVGLQAYDPKPDKRFRHLILDNYQLKPIGNHPYEDWHRGYLRRQVFDNPLFRIKRLYDRE